MSDDKIELPPGVMSSIAGAFKVEHDCSMDGKSAVWCVRHKESGKVYVGSSLHAAVELLAQRRALIEKRHESRHLQNAWNKYGEAAFEFTVLYNTTADDLKKAEEDFIRSLNATDPKHGYNSVKK